MEELGLVEGEVVGLGVGLGIYAQHACKGSVHALSSSRPFITATQSSLLNRLFGWLFNHHFCPSFLIYVGSAPLLNDQCNERLVVASLSRSFRPVQNCVLNSP